jgi:hypothetical protein
MEYMTLMFPAFSEILNSGHPAEVIKDLFVFFVAWRILKPFFCKMVDGIKKEMAGQMTDMRSEINKVVVVVQDLADHLKNLETKHEIRFTKLENEVSELKTKPKEG